MSNSIETEIERIQQAKADIKSAIEAKGVEVGDGLIDTYADKVAEISGGGSSYNAFKVESMDDPILEDAKENDYAILHKVVSRSPLVATDLPAELTTLYVHVPQSFTLPATQVPSKLSDVLIYDSSCASPQDYYFEVSCTEISDVLMVEFDFCNASDKEHGVAYSVNVSGDTATFTLEPDHSYDENDFTLDDMILEHKNGTAFDSVAASYNSIFNKLFSIPSNTVDNIEFDCMKYTGDGTEPLDSENLPETLNSFNVSNIQEFTLPSALGPPIMSAPINLYYNSNADMVNFNYTVVGTIGTIRLHIGRGCDSQLEELDYYWRYTIDSGSLNVITADPENPDVISIPFTDDQPLEYANSPLWETYAPYFKDFFAALFSTGSFSWENFPIVLESENATASDIRQGKKAFTNSGMVTGTLVPSVENYNAYKCNSVQEMEDIDNPIDGDICVIPGVSVYQKYDTADVVTNVLYFPKTVKVPQETAHQSLELEIYISGWNINDYDPMQGLCEVNFTDPTNATVSISIDQGSASQFTIDYVADQSTWWDEEVVFTRDDSETTDKRIIMPFPIFIAEKAMSVTFSDFDPIVGEFMYYSSESAVNFDDTFTSIAFPEQVVLDSAYTGSSVYAYLYNSIDGEDPGAAWALNLRSNGFYVSSNSGSIGELTVSYTSADGITYNRTGYHLEDPNGIVLVDINSSYEGKDIGPIAVIYDNEGDYELVSLTLKADDPVDAIIKFMKTTSTAVKTACYEYNAAETTWEEI